MTASESFLSITSWQLQREILQDLRHGPLDLYQVAADTCQAPFRVRAELRSLKRRHLVLQCDAGTRLIWELTDAGFRVVNAEDQLELIDGR